MGFWSKLGKGLAMGGAVLGAIPSGGATLAALGPIMGAGGAVLSGMADQSSANRAYNDTMRVQAGDASERALALRTQAEIDRLRQAREMEGQDFRKALLGASAANMQDVNIDRSQFRSNVPTIQFAGGTRPSIIGPQGRQAGQMLNNMAMQRLMGGEKGYMGNYTAMPEYKPVEPSSAGFWEKLAGIGGLGLTAAGQIAKARSAAPAYKPSMPSPTTGMPTGAMGTSIWSPALNQPVVGGSTVPNFNVRF